MPRQAGGRRAAQRPPAPEAGGAPRGGLPAVGSVVTLEAVVEHYNRDAQKRDPVEFLQTP